MVLYDKSRMKIRRIFPALLGAISLILAACSDRQTETADDGKFRVVVSVAPQKDFVQRIAGDLVHVDALVGDGQDPHDFSPSPSERQALSKAQMFITVGMPFEEALVEKLGSTEGGLQFISMGDGFEKIPSHCEHPSHDVEAAHGEGEGEDEHEFVDHEHGEDDPHVWLSPPLIKVQAANIAKGLSAALPDHAATFEANLAKFETELDTLHTELKEKLKPYLGKEFFVFHPAFGYFGYTYGIDQVAVEVNGNSPTPKELSEFIVHAKENGMTTLFVQPQFDDRSAKVIAEQLGAEVSALDPLAADPLQTIRAIADAIIK